MDRILVLRGGALGDFIVTLPALAALRARWPRARIEFAGNAVAAALAHHRGVIDAVHSQHEARWGALFSPAPLPADFAAWLARFDLVLNYWPDPDGELAAHFPRHAGQRFLAAPALPQCAPAAAHYAAALAPLGIRVPDTRFGLGPTPAPRRHGTTLHPGSGSPRKNWPLPHWLALVPQLPPPVTAIIGEAEAPVAAAFAAAGVSLLRGASLEELVAHLAATARFLGHDSGIGHLAAACDAPCVLLFGPTDAAVWAPPGPHVRVLHRGSELTAIGVDDVRRALAASG
jgi:ADP-heptose:LPS heptosyltransferase